MHGYKLERLLLIDNNIDKITTKFTFYDKKSYLSTRFHLHDYKPSNTGVRG